MTIVLFTCVVVLASVVLHQRRALRAQDQLITGMDSALTDLLALSLRLTLERQTVPDIEDEKDRRATWTH